MSTMPTPVDAPVFLPDELDERGAGVELIAVEPDGRCKKTARRTPHGWYVEEWEVVDFDGRDVWTSRWGSFISHDDIVALSRLNQEQSHAENDAG